MTSLTLGAADRPVAAAPIPQLTKRDLAHVPGETGWPIIGNTLRALRDPVAHVNGMHAKYGKVYRNHLLGFHGVTLLGTNSSSSINSDCSPHQWAGARSSSGFFRAD